MAFLKPKCWRNSVITGLIATAFVAFLCRLVELQIIRRPDQFTNNFSKHLTKLVIPANRGRICDIHNEILADDIPLYRIIVDGTKSILSRDNLAALIDATDLPEKQVRDKISIRRPYVLLKANVPENQATKLQEKISLTRMPGVSLEHDTIRNYPNGRALCHLLGFVGFNEDAGEKKGVQGIEMFFDTYLKGQPGYRWIERDRAGVELVQHRGVEQPARHGYNVQLAVDMGLQAIVESELDVAVKKFTPASAIAIMMRPSTGEILALANRPDFDLNQRNNILPELMRNRAISDVLEPGSTFKIVTHSAALQEKLVHVDTKIFCENGRWEYCGNTLHDAHPLGELTMREALAHSSNIAAGKLGVQLGENRLYRYIKLFGFGEKTGIDLPGEINGILHPVKTWSKISISHIPMGQEVGVTPIQIVSAMSVIANGGKLMRPQVVHAVAHSKELPILNFSANTLRQVLNIDVTNSIRDALEDVVSQNGTAKAAAVAGYKVAGKTGTAQKPGPNSGYLPGKYIVSFVGFMPAEKPEFVCLVILDEAHTKPGENYGGLVAAPVFARIAERAARYLNIEPTEPPLLFHEKPVTGKTPVFVKQNLSDPSILQD